MRLPSHLARAAVVALASVGCGGGGDDLPREPVSGKVTLDGQPLEKGMITFIPTRGTEPVASGVIEGGAYAVARADGPVPGPHRVTIWAKKPTGKKLRDPDNPDQMIEEVRDVIPPRYNLNSELTAEVKAGGNNTFDFDLTSAKAAPKASR